MDRSREKEALDKRRRLFGAILLAADGPVSAQSIAELVNSAVDEEEWDEAITVDEVVKTLSFMQSNFDGQHGIELVEVADGWRLRTAGDVAHVLRRLWPERRLRLSKAAMETLSIIAYRQPCTRPDVESVRGVDCGGVVRSLLDRGLVRVLGKKEEPGRPLLYGTTQFFLETFSLEDVSELPTLRHLDALDQEEALRALGELAAPPQEPPSDSS